jgi:hypothetical protein
MDPSVVAGVVLDFIDTVEDRVKQSNVSVEGFTLEWVEKVKNDFNNKVLSEDFAVVIFLAGRWYETILHHNNVDVST